MQLKGKPEIVASKEKSFTRISFKPDLQKFGMTKLDDDIVALLTKRVYDIAGSTNALCSDSKSEKRRAEEKCSVHLNGEKLDVKSFRDYCDLYLPSRHVISLGESHRARLTRQGLPQIYEKCSDRPRHLFKGQLKYVEYTFMINRQ